MKCNSQLDERQLLQRGNVFQHGLILFFALLLTNAFLKEEEIVWAAGMWENILIVWAVIALCLGEFAVREIYPMGGGMNVIYIVEGIAGVFLAAVSLFELLAGREPFAVDRTLTESGARLLQGAMMVLLLLVFVGKKVSDRGRRDEDEA
mgnify:FL=1